jgi:hypothetical protein
MEPLAPESTLEALTWSASLPPASLLDEMNVRFPIQSPHVVPRDELGLGTSFGALTSLGVLQMRKFGNLLRKLCPSAPLVPGRVLSSNFRRTQFSAQCVLHGLSPPPSAADPAATPLHISVSGEGSDFLNVWSSDANLRRLLHSNGSQGDVLANTPEEDEAKALLLKAVPAFGFMIRPFSWLAALDHTQSREGKMGGGGPLRGRSAPKRAQDLFASLSPLPSSRALDLAELKKGMHLVFGSAFFSDALLAEIDRNADGRVDPDEFSNFLTTLRLPAPHGGVTLDEFHDAARVVERAVCRRFDAILSKTAVRKLASRAVLQRVMTDLSTALDPAAVPAAAGQAGTTVDLYATHDATLIPLKKELALWSGENAQWLGLASCLVFELRADGTGKERLRVYASAGVRGANSGLEPNAMRLEPVAAKFGGDTADEEEGMDFAAARAWVQSM